MASDGTQLSDNHIVNVAGHGIDPSPVPPEPEDTNVSSGFQLPRGLRARHSNSALHAKPSKSSFLDSLLWFICPVILVILLRVFVFGVYVIPSGSMMDTIQVGDYVLTSKLTPGMFPLHRGDIVVFEDPAHWLNGESAAAGSKDLIKRLIGLPGDVVECKGPGEPVKVNGVAVHEYAYIKPGVDPSSFPFKIKVKPGHVFVLGDNRSNSADSRYHKNDGDDGLVPISKIKGVALVRCWPLNRAGILEDHTDAFDDVPNSSK